MKFSASEIFENEIVLTEIKNAWNDSVPSLSDGHEEGGFIVIDEFENLSVVRWEKGKQNEIVLPPHRNCFTAERKSSRRFTRIRISAEIFSKNRV